MLVDILEFLLKRCFEHNLNGVRILSIYIRKVIKVSKFGVLTFETYLSFMCLGTVTQLNMSYQNAELESTVQCKHDFALSSLLIGTVLHFA